MLHNVQIFFKWFLEINVRPERDKAGLPVELAEDRNCGDRCVWGGGSVQEEGCRLPFFFFPVKM